MAKQTLTVQLMHANTRIAHLEEELRIAREQIDTMAGELVRPRPVATAAGKPDCRDYDSNQYIQYVRDCKQWHAARGDKVVGYKTFPQFMHIHRVAA